ncbi:hypothetical protein JR316_0011854 [Psilocybe cubensis]|uniref:Uncharacterized protein n=1 Tax=Psilocybe cubensis TaxID=181762 RepID=A0ACB8GL61_PSICU|nr:hypothetical protein JR316_0011854 [Psilocybe cubensis]KAH9476281.1 hypothetical protein JR316_0011854 [Psilocybe cubensis]
MPLPSLQIIESEEESSLHPRAIWNHWKRNIIWDPRSYYGALEFSGLLVLYFSYMNITQNIQYNVLYTLAKFTSGLFLLIPIAILHWYSNHRQSNSILTLFLSQLIGLGVHQKCYSQCEFITSVDILLWITIPIPKNARKDSVPPEDPSPAVIDSYPEDLDGSQRAWGDSTIADGIEDDSVPQQGQIRL